MVLYKHNRSGKIYELVAQAAHTEDKSSLIVYTDFSKSDKDIVRVWARPSEMFFEYVTMENGEEKPRFEIFEDYKSLFSDDEKVELEKIYYGAIKTDDKTKYRNAEFLYSIGGFLG